MSVSDGGSKGPGCFQTSRRRLLKRPNGCDGDGDGDGDDGDDGDG
eukprot:CAMPEP_0173420122 /NCGR_PEP_ID=MMETSP1357-20121228/1729_1 /TAXON_ID=77926 /ORGANISM="Hemiselmis rufescens, Strain PCC563" /LENGTH=44 /DNA_ID= /DNA_START= /DNA_END= /DNA_ORIENTATION=